LSVLTLSHQRQLVVVVVAAAAAQLVVAAAAAAAAQRLQGVLVATAYQAVLAVRHRMVETPVVVEPAASHK